MKFAPTLQRPPRYDRWPVALRSAMLLRGALVRCGPGVRGVSWPDCAAVRLEALRPWLTEDLVAVHLTAAWVWGAALDPADPLCIASLAGRRPAPSSSPGVRRYEQRFSPDELVSFGALRVTNELRTILDLLHIPGEFGCAERLACALMISRLP